MATPDATHPEAGGVAGIPVAPKVNILLVDDETRNLDVLESVLQSPEYNLVRVLSAEGALMKLLDGDFAAIVLDIQMPEMSGIELANIIKQRKRTQLIPIIFLTAYYQEEREVLEAYGTGAVDYLTKPIRPQILKSKVAVIVDHYRKTRALAATNAVLELEVAQRQNAEEALRLANIELEARVQARTSDLQNANSELRDRESALRDSQSQLQLVTDHAPVFLIQCDRSHRLKFANRTFAERFGFEPNQLIGMHFKDVIGEAAYAEFRHNFDATLDGQRIEFETKFSHAAAGPRWLHVIQEPERAPGGDVVGLVAVISDITERKLVEHEILLARDKALAASRAKDDFLARLSHELRTPLNPVLLVASDAASDAKLPEGVRSDFAMIAQSVALEARLIDDLLDLSRIAHGKLSLELQPHDIHSIILEAMAMVQSEIAQKHLAVALELKADMHTVLCDDVRLKQVFWNLMKNAVKFTPEGGQITIETRRAPENEDLVIKIIDTGIGLVPEEIARIFEAFSQGDHSTAEGSSHFGGLGLGLAISRMLVEQHSGYIRALSAGRNLGSTFLVELPLYHSGAREEDPAISGHLLNEGSPPPELRIPGTMRRALLVEDHRPTRKALAQLLSRRQFEVVSVGTVSEARAAASHGAFDIVISDIGLPDGNGYDLMTELRSRYGLVGIALTGYGRDEDVDRSQAAGFSAHLTKPVSIEGLECALASASRAPADNGG